jgi:hypothetical protein
MKFLSVLLFLSELLAPAVFASVSDVSLAKEDSQVMLISTTHQQSLMALALFEESSSEGEREGKGSDEVFAFVDHTYCIELFNSLEKFEAVKAEIAPIKERFDIHPPLFTLHCVYTI